MMIRRWSSAFFLLAAGCALAACGSRETGAASAAEPATTSESSALTEATSEGTPAVSARAGASVVFAQYTLSPDGRVDGLLLKDGTAVRYPPGAPGAEATLTAGDALRVDGVRITTPTGDVLRSPVVHKGETLVADYSASSGPPPGSHPGGPGGHRHGPGPDSQLARLSAAGTITAILSRPDGAIDALVLSDGTTARLPPHASKELSLRVGDAVSLTGRGASSKLGQGMFAHTLTLASGEVITVALEPTPIDATGTIDRVLVNPFGHADGLLLTDGTLVRLPPSASSKLTAGARVTIQGESIGALIHARKITSSSGEELVTEPTEPTEPPPQHAARPSLAALDEDSTVARIVRSPSGGVDTLVLADGAVVRVPPPLGEQLGASLAVGDAVRVHGEGGRYEGGVSMFARSVTLASGAMLSAPEPPAGGRMAPPPL